MDDVSTDGANAAKAARWAEGCRRHKAISRLCRLRRAAAAKIRCGGRRLGLGVSRTTLYRLIEPYKTFGTVDVLQPSATGRRSGTWVLPKATEQIIEETIHNVYLKPTRPTLTHLVDCVHARCTEEGVAPPHRRTVRARVKAIDIRVRADGAANAISSRRPQQSLGNMQLAVRLRSCRSIIQKSTSSLSTNLPGRPWLTLAIDVFSRVVTGLHVSVSAPSRVSASLLGTGSANPVSH